MSCDTALLRGRVTAKSTGQYTVRWAGGSTVCALSSKLRRELVYPLADPASSRHRVVATRDIAVVDPVAVGDEVDFLESSGGGQIVAVAERRNRLSRRAPGAKPLEQVIVANVDLAIPVVSTVEPELKWSLLDRYLVDIEAAGLPALVCITKIDRIDPAELADGLADLAAAGYRVLLCSSVTGQGLDELRAATRGRLSVVLGKSGVGKTSLLNALEPGLGLRVSSVGETTRKGRHTTTTVAMWELTGGGWLVDTPGMREFAAWQLDAADLDDCFPELRPYLGQCRFGRCTHLHEPGCAVRAAVAAGRIRPRRYDSYVALRGA